VAQELEKVYEIRSFVPQEEIETILCKISSRKQSKVGAELSDIITKRVIVAVLLMLCVVPLLTYSPPVTDAQQATAFLQKINLQVPANGFQGCDVLRNSAITFKEYWAPRPGDSSLSIIALSIMPSRCNSKSAIDFEDVDTISGVRDRAVKVISLTDRVDGEHFVVAASFNLQPLAEQASAYSLALTLFVIVILLVLSAQFNRDAQKLVLSPLEEMMDMVNMVAQDPLENHNFPDKTSSQYETRVVQLAIQKITTLLRVGFGVAGAGIISSNMSVEGEDGSELKPMIPGKRMYALFGFCDIQSFDFLTERLEDEIMTFVNSIARIVHGEVTRWGGLCNRNLGNAFLMVWRIGDEVNLIHGSGSRRTSFKSDEKKNNSI